MSRYNGLEDAVSSAVHSMVENYVNELFDADKFEEEVLYQDMMAKLSKAVWQANNPELSYKDWAQKQPAYENLVEGIREVIG
jgi:hypothetical protein